MKINKTYLMSGLLEKIAWKTRRWNFKYQSFILYLHNDTTWGFSIVVFKSTIESIQCYRSNLDYLTKPTLKYYH